jgi:hypothetical protein
MNKARILSFELSHKINEAEIKKVSAGHVGGTVQMTFDPITGARHLTFDS